MKAGKAAVAANMVPGGRRELARLVRLAGLVAVSALVLALVAAGFLGVRSASAQTATSEQSSWANVPYEPSPALDDPLVRRGAEVFHARCIACHGEIPDETLGDLFLPPMPGTQALLARYRGAVPAVLDERTDLTPALVETVVRKGLNSMPFFRPTELSADDLAALSAYLTRKRD